MSLKKITLTLDTELFIDTIQTFPWQHPVRERVNGALEEIARGELCAHTGKKLQLLGITIENVETVPE